MQAKTVTVKASRTTSTLARGPFILVGIEGPQPFSIYKGQPFEADGELLYTLDGQLEESIVLTAAHCLAVEHPHDECTYEFLPQESAPQMEETPELEARWGKWRRNK